jgi:hypothetical protein
VLRASTNPCKWVWVKPLLNVSVGPDRAWIFPYVEYPVERRGRDVTVLRPVVEVTLVGSEDTTKVAALVDSGCENTLVGPWLPRTIGVKPDPSTEFTLGIGGAPRKVRMCQMTLRLHSPDGGETVEWHPDVGVIMSNWEPPFPAVLGQVGFFDAFTVTMHRGAQVLVVEDWMTFDKRFTV